MQKITPFLWFDNNGEEAMDFYVSVFKDSKEINVSHYKAEGPDGKVTTGTFRIAGQEFMFINGGPMFKFSEAISLFINCETQQEIDYLWEKLSAGGSKSQCGWLKDKYGLSWQVVPSILGKLLGDPDKEKSKRTMAAMLKMHKLDIEALQKAHDGE